MMILAQSLIAAWLVALLLPQQGRLAIVAALAPYVAALLVQTPFAGGLSAAMALRGLIGDPSFTTLLLLTLALARKSPPAFVADWRGPFVILALGLLLYPDTLGLFGFDVYRLGYRPAGLIALLAIPAALAAWRGETIWLWLLGFDLLGYGLGLSESPNLWDSLIDPLLFVAAFVLLIRYAVRKFRSPARHET